MTAEALPVPGAQPFQIVAASYLIEITPERALTLGELSSHLITVPGASVFYHTFQSLESHHYTSYSNDFAQWSLAACNEPSLAERLASIDLRDFVAVDELRQVLVETLDDYLSNHPTAGSRPAFEPFYFCEAMEVVVPLDSRAETLAQLARAIQEMSLQTLHYHFINSRLRLQLRTNDFSNWIEKSLNESRLARLVNQVDFYTNTLEGVRREIGRVIQSWIQP